MRRRWRWIGHVTRHWSIHCENCFTLDTRRETQEGLPQDHVATDSGERNQVDREELGRHQAYAKEPLDMEGACCYPTCHFGVKGIGEWVIFQCSVMWHTVWLSLIVHSSTSKKKRFQIPCIFLSFSAWALTSDIMRFLNSKKSFSAVKKSTFR